MGRGQPATLSDLLDPVAGRHGATASSSAGPFAGALRAGAGATMAAEVGLVMGYMSQRVLGQYELSLLGPTRAPRLLFVAPNLEQADRRAGADRDELPRAGSSIHELTHVFQFGGVPWLRDHLGGLLREYLATVEVQIQQRRGRRRCPRCPTPAELGEPGSARAAWRRWSRAREQRGDHGAACRRRWPWSRATPST